MTAPLDTTVPLATYLTTNPAGHTGTWSDVHEDTKLDRTVDEDGNPVDPVDASDCSTKIGAVWGVSVDAAWLAEYQALHLAAKVWERANAAARDALGSLNGLAVDDLLHKLDDHTMWYCTAVVGASESTWAALSLTGDVTGPASSTDNALTRFDGTTGKTLQNSTASLSDTGNLTINGNILVTGTVDGVDVAADATALATHVADTANPHTTNLAQVLATNGNSGGAGNDLTMQAGDPFILQEQASVPGGAPAAGYGKVWVANTAPNLLMFTDDVAADHVIGDVVSTESAVTNFTVPKFSGTGGKRITKSNVAIDASDNLHPTAGSPTLGTSSNPWFGAWIEGNVTLDVSSPGVILDKADAGDGYIDWLNNAVRRWQLRMDSGEEFSLRRYDSSGVFQDAPILVQQASGNVTLAQALTLSAAAAVLTAGDNTGSPSSLWKKSAAGTVTHTFSTGSGSTANDKRIAFSGSEELLFQHHNGTSFVDLLSFSGDGTTATFASIVTGVVIVAGDLDVQAGRVKALDGAVVGNESALGSRILSGSGAPGAGLGADGDFYLRTDGGSGTCIYQKRTGTWTATGA